MGEVKVFSATVRGRIKPTLVYQGRFDEFWISLEEVAGFITHPNHYVERLVELELHEAGMGVWIEGVSVEDLFEMVKKSKAIMNFGATRHLGEIQDKVYLQLETLAQLSPQPEAIEEQVSLGEHDENCDWFHHVCVCSRSKPSPAKVGIELTEEEARTFIEWMGWDTETHNSIKVRIQTQLDLLSPPVELPEPKEPEIGEVCEIEPKGIGAMIETNTRNVWVKGNESREEPWVGLNHFNPVSNSWRNLSGYSPVLLSKGLPRVIGGEK